MDRPTRIKEAKTFGSKAFGTSLIDVTLRGEFHGSCIDPARNGEASYADPNGAIDAAVKAKLDNYQHDYSERNFLFLPAVMTTSGRISGDFLRLLYLLAHRQAANFFTHGHPGSLLQGIQATPGHLFLLQPRCHRARLRPGHRNEDRHRPTQTPSQ
jgi:hypothetical protein